MSENNARGANVAPDETSSSIGAMINRFRTAKPTTRDDRNNMRQAGLVKEFWWNNDTDDRGEGVGDGRRGPLASPNQRYRNYL